MTHEAINNTYKILAKTVQTTFLDYSLPIVVILMISVNIYSLWRSEVIYQGDPSGIIYEPIYWSAFFAVLVVMGYGAYLGAKLFASDIDSGRIYPLMMIPGGRRTLLFGKISAGIVILALLSVVYPVHILLSLSYWGTISYLTIQRTMIYSLLIFSAGLFLFSFTTTFSLLSRKVLPTILFSSIYIISMFFATQFIESAERSLGTLVTVGSFPILSVMYHNLFIEEFGFLPANFMYVPFLGTICFLILSFFLFEVMEI